MNEFEKIKSVIVDQLGVDESTVTMESDAESITTVGDAVRYIKDNV